MRIELAELKQVVDILFDHIMKTRGVTSCELDADYYWTVLCPEVYDMTEHPKQLGVGSLYEDWEFLSAILEPDNQPLASELTKLAPLLHYLGGRLREDLAQYGG